MDKNNEGRMSTARLIAEALRKAPPGGAQSQPGAAQSFPVNMQNPAMSYPLDPYEVDGQYGG
jgi:hypothetical protein